jgi:hypothetical protein
MKSRHSLMSAIGISVSKLELRWDQILSQKTVDVANFKEKAPMKPARQDMVRACIGQDFKIQCYSWVLMVLVTEGPGP